MGGFSLLYLQLFLDLQLFLESSFHHKIKARTVYDGRTPQTNHTIGSIIRLVIVDGIWLDEK